MAIPWTEAWAEIAARCAAPPRLLLAFDFDGTLAPLVSTPAAAQLPAQTLGALRTLQAVPGICLAIISGRSLPDLISRVPLPDAIFAGNHGLEIRGLGLDGERIQAAALKPRLRILTGKIQQSTAGISGLFIENKGLSLTVHLRNVLAGQRDTATRIVEQTGKGDPAFRLQHGNLVLEYIPDIGWDKGSALKQITARLGIPRCATVYAGDDTTDETVFTAMPTAVTIRVGEAGPTAARWTARDPADVLRILNGIARCRIPRGGTPMIPI
ncbi:MAG: trehalose-phosphatase [Verrucomicrobiales bacterium]|nr:trehalose-phosphatase [Verrucomicrobiales bacterium]